MKKVFIFTNSRLTLFSQVQYIIFENHHIKLVYFSQNHQNFQKSVSQKLLP